MQGLVQIVACDSHPLIVPRVRLPAISLDQLAGAPGCFSGCARAKASIVESELAQIAKSADQLLISTKFESLCAHQKIRHLAKKTDRQETQVSARGNQWGNNSPGRQARAPGRFLSFRSSKTCAVTVTDTAFSVIGTTTLPIRPGVQWN